MVKNIVFVLLILAAPFVVIKEASAICSSTTTTGVGKSLWVKQSLLIRDYADPYTEELRYGDGYDKVGNFTVVGVPYNIKALFAKQNLVRFCFSSAAYGYNSCSQPPGYVYGVCVGKGIQIWVKNGYQNQITTDAPADGTWARVVMDMNNFLNGKMDYDEYSYPTNDYYLDYWSFYGQD